MNDYELNIRLSEVSRAINAIKSDVEILMKTIKPEKELWDSSDIIRNWKVSERTLADWRKKKMIGYVQIHKKIYYPRVERENFLSANSIKGGANE
jgi:hypothetical protein